MSRVIGGRFIAALTARVFGDDESPDPEVVRAFAEGMRRAFAMADKFQVPEHRAGMCRMSSSACRRRAMLGTNTCEVHAGAMYRLSAEDIVRGDDDLRALTMPDVVDAPPAFERERVDIHYPDGSVGEGELVARHPHPQGDIVVADLSKPERKAP